MKPKIIIILAYSLLWASGTLCAQQKSGKFNPNESYEELTWGGGITIPMKGMAESSGMAFVDYAAFGFGGLGFHGGARYTYSNNDVLTHIELPLKVAWRSNLRGKERWNELPEALIPDTYMTYTPSRGVEYETESFGNVLARIFFGILPQRIEFNAGITPGYIFGGDVSFERIRYGGVNGTEDLSYTVHKKFGLSVSVEAGMKLTYRIWRFELSLNPAVHYCLTDNFDIHSSTVNGMPSRLFFSFSGGLGFMF